MRGALIVALCWVTGVAAAGCSEPASVLFVVDAHPIVRHRADRLSFRAWGSPQEPLELTTDEPFSPGRWPVLALIDPRGGDTDRRWAFEVAVQDASGRRFLARRVRGTFRPGEIRRVDLYLEPPCITDDGLLLCGDWYDDTCLRGECVPTPEDDGEVWDGSDPREESTGMDGGADAAAPPDDGGADAGAADDAGPMTDAGGGGMDAAMSMDAGMSMDAATSMDAGPAPSDGGTDAGPPPMDAGECPCPDTDPCVTTECVMGRCVDTPIDCDDANPCTDDSCSGGSCVHADVTDGTACGANTCCGGTCLDTDRDPAHCGGCGAVCSSPTPACLGGGCAACSVPSDCPAPSSCESVDCTSGSCVYSLDAGWCRIGGTCVANGAASPGNPCAVCDTGRSTSSYSPAGTGTSCADDGISCTIDRCAASSTTCEHPLRTDRCRIGGTCYADGDPNPSMGCEECDPARSRTSWTPRADGFVGCGGAQTMCCGGGCVGTCTHVSTPYCDGAAQPGNECAVCNGATHAWDAVGDGTTCGGGGGACDSGTCAMCDPPCPTGMCCTLTAPDPPPADPMCGVCQVGGPGQ